MTSPTEHQIIAALSGVLAAQYRTRIDLMQAELAELEAVELQPGYYGAARGLIEDLERQIAGVQLRQDMYAGMAASPSLERLIQVQNYYLDQEQAIEGARTG